MMVEFWHDHFNVAGWDFSIAPVFVQHDRDAIRPEALGNFRTMLESVAKSTAMLYYLDNRANRSGGYNENWARELMELHTLGADVYYPGAFHGFIPIGDDDGQAIGYSDADVYDVARCFTGWTVRNGHWQFPNDPDYDTGEFFYYSNWHEGGSKFVLGQWIFRRASRKLIVVMDRLCRHQATARNICRKLCRRFIADEPPSELVESAAAVWRNTGRRRIRLPGSCATLSFLGRAGRAGQQGATTVRAAGCRLRKTAAEIEPRHYDDWSPYGELFSRFQQTGHAVFAGRRPMAIPIALNAGPRHRCWGRAGVAQPTARVAPAQ
jgi:uncharacterized protein (DUF1800 family)